MANTYTMFLISTQYAIYVYICRTSHTMRANKHTAYSDSGHVPGRTNGVENQDGGGEWLVGGWLDEWVVWVGWDVLLWGRVWVGGRVVGWVVVCESLA
jgi:hypothetical protein